MKRLLTYLFIVLGLGLVVSVSANAGEVNKKIKVDLMLKLFGSKVKLATVDLSRYYKPTFEFPGPTLNQKNIGIEMPDGTKKVLNINTDNHNLVLEQGRITVYSDIIFSP